VSCVLPFTQLHHVETEISAYEHYEAPSCKSTSTNKQSSQAQNWATKSTMSPQTYRTWWVWHVLSRL
jgi:hypothetical protein